MTISLQSFTELQNRVAVLSRKVEETDAVLAASQSLRSTPAPGSVQVISSSKLDAFRAFGAAVEISNRKGHDGQEAARIFARELAPLLYRKGADGRLELIPGAGTALIQAARDDVKIQASNSLGTLSGSLIAQASLGLLKYELPFLSSLAADFSNAAAKYGAQIITRTRGIPAVQTYSTTTGYADADATDVDVPVTMDQHKYVQIGYNANELAGTNRDLFDEQVEGCNYALGKDMVDAVLALITTTNFPGSPQKTVQAQSGFDRSIVKSMGKAMTKRGNLKKGRTLLLNVDYYDQLGLDPALVTLSAFQDPEFLREDRIGRVAGFDAFEVPNLPNTNNLVGFGFTKGALVLATRLPNDYTQILPGASYGNVSQITDPDTNLTLMLVQYVSHDAGKSRFRLALMYGAALGDANRGQLLVSA